MFTLKRAILDSDSTRACSTVATLVTSLFVFLSIPLAIPILAPGLSILSSKLCVALRDSFVSALCRSEDLCALLLLACSSCSSRAW